MSHFCVNVYLKRGTFSECLYHIIITSHMNNEKIYKKYALKFYDDFRINLLFKIVKIVKNMYFLL